MTMSILGLVVVGLAGGAILASTGVIGPFLVPALILLELPTSVARGTCLVSESLMTFFSLLVHRRARNLDKRVILAFLPGAVTVALGANLSVRFPELFMRLIIGVFEIIIGIVMVATVRWSDKRFSRTVETPNIMAKLMMVAVLAGFAKGFLGIGWGPIGVALYVLLGINPRVVVGSSLVIRLLLDLVGGLTYANMSLVDANSVLILTLAGCATAPLAVKLTTVASEKTLSTVLGLVTMVLGGLVVIGQ